MIGVLQRQNVRQKEETFVEKGRCLIIITTAGIIIIGTMAGITTVGIIIIDGITIVIHSFLDGSI